MARTPIAALPRGHEFVPASFAVSPDGVRAYLVATGDANDYGDTVPALCVVALGLNALQQQIALPEGALHTGQEIEHLAPVLAGASLQFSGRVAQRSERQGFVISVIEFEIADGSSQAIRARTTIMAPAASA